MPIDNGKGAAMPKNPADVGTRGGPASPSPHGGSKRMVIEHLADSECLELLGAARVGRLAYTGRYGPTVLPVVYKLHEGSIVFHTFRDTFTEEDLRTGIADAEYHVAFEIEQIDPEALEGWTVLVTGPAHHVDTEAEYESIIEAGADPLPEAEAEHLIRVKLHSITGLHTRRT
jgi:nitroimidazol reductase NimA-like FMN-containing flavoprotein (pyridoxamine 5'-phosphate oxidase superfamily)